MADIDYGELRIYPGNYDDFMMASTQARELLQSENAKKKTQMAELQQFVSRFSANAHLFVLLKLRNCTEKR